MGVHRVTLRLMGLEPQAFEPAGDVPGAARVYARLGFVDAGALEVFTDV